MVGKTVSHYKILEKLGEGGMGVVYKAHDTELDRTVALKFLPHGLTADESEQARFLQEAKAASALNHANICTIYTLGEHEGERFIVMEFVDGKTLRQLVPVKKLQDAIVYAIQIAEALQEAHSHGIVHRDIKAENIMVNTKGQVKVMDFGLAKLKGSLKLTKTSSTIGTLAYMAPEQIQGGEVDARSDIFSFGIVVYEMLTGHLPFRGEHEAAMVYSIVNEQPEPLQHYVPDAPSELLHILDRALEKDQEDRYQTVHEMLIDLRRLKKDSSRVSRQVSHEPPMSSSAPPRSKAREKQGRSKRLWLGALLLGVLCVSSALFVLLRKPAVRLNPNRTSVTLGAPFAEINIPTVSRDGNSIAFSARSEDQTWDIYMMNTAGGKPRRVTHESAYFSQICDIAPDMSQIVYDCWILEPGLVSRIKLAASQEGETRTLADTGVGPKWKPDGTRIGYIRLGKDTGYPSVSGKFEIWSIRPDGTDNCLEFIDTSTTRPPYAFCWSPDGGSITWVRNYPGGYGEVMVRELSTGKERLLTSYRKNVDEVIWATNDEILFTSNKSGQTNLWMVPASGGEATQVTYGAVSISGPRISADNRTLVYIQQTNVARLWISSVDGSNAQEVASAEINVDNAEFSPDGKHILYVAKDTDPYNKESHLYVMDRDGKNQRELPTGSEQVSFCRGSHDGAWLAYFSRTMGEPPDSNRLYLIQPFNPGPPRLLGKGRWFSWADNVSLYVFSQMKTLKYSVKGGAPTQVYEDSTCVAFKNRTSELVFYDFRKGQDTWMVVAVDSIGRKMGKERRIENRSDVLAAMWSQDFSFWIFKKRRGSLWRMSTSTGKEERVGTALPGETVLTHISMDDKEILWISKHYPAKLVLEKDVFE